jgi:hypothetical protein
MNKYLIRIKTFKNSTDIERSVFTEFVAAKSEYEALQKIGEAHYKGRLEIINIYKI